MVRKGHHDTAASILGIAAVDFPAEVWNFSPGSDPERLLRACGKVRECKWSISPEIQHEISQILREPFYGHSYADAAAALSRWAVTVKTDVFQSQPG